MSTDEIQLLDLPDEVLFEIISYLRHNEKDLLSETCKQLYYLVCDSTKDSHCLDISYSELVCSEVISSIANTHRKFNNLTINLCHCLLIDEFIFEKIETVIKKFGPRLKKFKLWNSIQSKASEISERQLCGILENMPLLETFIFKNINVRKSEGIDKREFNLKKLHSMVLDYCLFDTTTVLLKFPENSIRELTFTFECNDETPFQEFFNRQRNIKKLEHFENEKISFEHLELEHLKISSNCNFPLLIQQQPHLKYLDFAITWVTDDTFEEVCKLKHLKVLRTLIDLISMRVFLNLKNMPQLKELRLDSHSSYDMGYLQELSLMKGMRFEKLTFIFSERKINSEIIIQMANNFHNLKHVEIINRSISILDTFIQYFPRLESILLDYFAVFGAPNDNLVISSENEEFRHENLKQLVVTYVNVNEAENTIALLRVVQICVNLERIMLSKLINFTNNNLHEILVSHPLITHLSIETDEKMIFNEDTFETIMTYGKKLKYFRLNGFKNCAFNYKTLKEIFMEKFPIISLYRYSSDEHELIMKKRNTEDWHLSFKLMDHF